VIADPCQIAAGPRSTGEHSAAYHQHWVVAAIVALVVFLAAGFTAATRPATGSAPGAITLSSTTTPLADGGTTVDFVNGITLTVAPGWRVFTSNHTGIWARNSDRTASIAVVTGHPHTPDIASEMAWLINQDITTNGYMNVVQDPSSEGVQTVQGKHFTQELLVGYTGNRQTDQGTQQLYGIWTELFNSATQQDAFIDLRAASMETLAAAIPDAKRMTGSIL
jgi:hypothetical protein